MRWFAFWTSQTRDFSILFFWTSLELCMLVLTLAEEADVVQ